jgi:hypothetical protein
LAITPESRAHFTELLEGRRLDLGLTLRLVAQEAGMSYESLRAIRAGTGGNPRALTLRGVDRALYWRPGSAERVLYDGGEPDALPLPRRILPDEVRRLLRADEPGDNAGNGS